jgi:hypothetical protein
LATILLSTPHVPRFCERHDGPPVLRPEDATHCEHFDVECSCDDASCSLSHVGDCCYCGSQTDLL